MADDDKRFERIEDAIDDMPKGYVPRPELLTLTGGLDRRVSAIEDTHKWLVRLIGGMLVVSIMSLVLIGKKTGAM